MGCHIYVNVLATVLVFFSYQDITKILLKRFMLIAEHFGFKNFKFEEIMFLRYLEA